MSDTLPYVSVLTSQTTYQICDVKVTRLMFSNRFFFVRTKLGTLPFFFSTDCWNIVHLSVHLHGVFSPSIFYGCNSEE